MLQFVREVLLFKSDSVCLSDDLSLSRSVPLCLLFSVSVLEKSKWLIAQPAPKASLMALIFGYLDDLYMELRMNVFRVTVMSVCEL